MGTEKVTLKDIAQAVGKSVATVSKALHEHADIAPKTRGRIKQVAQEMGYRPNITAQRLQKKRTDVLGLILPVLSARQADPFFSELLAGVADEAANDGYDLLVSTRARGPEEQTAYQRIVSQRRVDGVIVAQPRQEDWRIDFLTNEGIPFVIVGHMGGGKLPLHTTGDWLNLPGVWVDTGKGIKQAVTHLVEEGRSNIALILPPANLLFAKIFSQAFKTAITDYPTLKGQTSIEINIKALSQKEGYQAAQTLLAATNVPDAIIACHDLVAMGAMAAASGQGFEVGNDIAVLGFGDILLAEHTQPPLTTIHQPTFTIGQRACKMLLDIIAGQPLAQSQVIIEPWLVVRQSSSLALWL